MPPVMHKLLMLTADVGMLFCQVVSLPTTPGTDSSQTLIIVNMWLFTVTTCMCINKPFDYGELPGEWKVVSLWAYRIEHGQLPDE